MDGLRKIRKIVTYICGVGACHGLGRTLHFFRGGKNENITVMPMVNFCFVFLILIEMRLCKKTVRYVN